MKNHSYRTLDRIENLKITINLYRKSEIPILIDSLLAGWQETVLKHDIQAASTETIDKSQSPLPSTKKSRNTRSKQKALKRSIYTVVNMEDRVNLLTSGMQRINIAKDFFSSFKSSTGLERDLNPAVPSKGYGFFAPSDLDALAAPSSEDTRWIEHSNQSIYSDMKFVAVISSKSGSSDEAQIINVFQDETDIEHDLCCIHYYGNGNFSISVHISLTIAQLYKRRRTTSVSNRRRPFRIFDRKLLCLSISRERTKREANIRRILQETIQAPHRETSDVRIPGNT